MNRVKVLLTLLILASSAWALPLGSSARTVTFRCPADHFCGLPFDEKLEYRYGVKAQVLPENLKQFEAAPIGVRD